MLLGPGAGNRQPSRNVHQFVLGPIPTGDIGGLGDFVRCWPHSRPHSCSPGRIRTSVDGFKVRCPATRRPGIAPAVDHLKTRPDFANPPTTGYGYGTVTYGTVTSCESSREIA